MSYYKIFSQNNDVWKNVFSTLIRPSVLEMIQDIPQVVDVVLTGSRSVGLAYPQYDLEFAVVVQDGTEENIKKALTHIVAGYMDTVSKDVKTFRTKAGLHLMISRYTVFGMWKLECTIRETFENKKIQTNMTNTVNLWSDEKKTAYIQNMQKMFLTNDKEGMNRSKSWMKVLEEK